MLSLSELSAILLTLFRGAGLGQSQVSSTPHTIGLLIMNVVASLILVGIDAAVTDRPCSMHSTLLRPLHAYVRVVKVES